MLDPTMILRLEDPKCTCGGTFVVNAGIRTTDGNTPFDVKCESCGTHGNGEIAPGVFDSLPNFGLKTEEDVLLFAAAEMVRMDQAVDA